MNFILQLLQLARRRSCIQAHANRYQVVWMTDERAGCRYCTSSSSCLHWRRAPPPLPLSPGLLVLRIIRQARYRKSLLTTTITQLLAPCWGHCWSSPPLSLAASLQQDSMSMATVSKRQLQEDCNYIPSLGTQSMRPSQCSAVRRQHGLLKLVNHRHS